MPSKADLKLFNDTEIKILKIIGRKKVKICDVTKEFHKGTVTPLNARTTMATAVRRITRKCEWYKLKWTITGTGTGRKGRSVWVETI